MIPGIASYGWAGLVQSRDIIGNPDSDFRTGAGTFYPLPSMPLQQALRYLWAAKRWRVAYNIVQTETVSYSLPFPPPTQVYKTTCVLDTGMIPYTCSFAGYDNTSGEHNKIFPRFTGAGDLLAMPKLAWRNRTINFVLGGPWFGTFLPCPIMGNFSPQAVTGQSNDDPPVTVDGTTAQAFSIYVGFGNLSLFSGTSIFPTVQYPSPPMVWDPDRPGYVYLSLCFVQWDINTLLRPEFSGSGALVALCSCGAVMDTTIGFGAAMAAAEMSAHFDGQEVPLYRFPDQNFDDIGLHESYTMTGSWVITTSDTDS